MSPSTPPDLTARALLKWPNVPASHGWLGLDARGRWRIQGALISHPGIREFLARQYAGDAAGRWYVQNGPQRAYVDLELAPWVLNLDGHGALVTHTGRAITRVDSLVVTDDAEILLGTDLGLGAVLDQDLASFLDALRAGDRAPTDGEVAAWILAEDAHAPPPDLRWGRWPIEILRLPRSALEARFGFIRQPRAAAAEPSPAAPDT